MDKNALINLLEGSNPKTRILNSHKANLRRALLNDRHFDKSGSYQYMNIARRSVIGLGFLAILLVVVFSIMQPKQSAIAKDFAQNAITKISELSQVEKQNLTHYLGKDPEVWLNEAYNATDLKLDQYDSVIGDVSVKLNRLTYTDPDGATVALYFTDDNIITSASIHNSNLSYEEWVKQSEERYLRNKQEIQYTIGDETKLRMARILEMANSANDRKIVGTETVDGEVINKYTFTDPYSRTILYSVDKNNIIHTLQVMNTPKGNVVPAAQGLPSNWVTYTNPFGYEVSYPRSWEGQDGSGSTPYELSSYSLSNEPTDYDTFNIVQFSVREGTINRELALMGKDIQVSDTSLNGHDAKVLTHDLFKIYLLENEGKIYKIDVLFGEQYNSEKDNVDRIISSYKIK